MIMVVIVHSNHQRLNLGGEILRLDAGFNAFIQFFFSEGIARVAVPIFFIISGYLFFLNFQGTKSEFISKYKKRAKSLLVPFLFWSINCPPDFTSFSHIRGLSIRRRLFVYKYFEVNIYKSCTRSIMVFEGLDCNGGAFPINLLDGQIFAINPDFAVFHYLDSVSSF